MINIVCLKWGDRYSVDYVNRLLAMTRRHVTKDFQFWCFTEDARDIDPDVRVLDLMTASTLETWWNKIFLFAPDNGLPENEQIFYIDLDTLIVSNIDDLLTVSQISEIVVLRDFYQGIARSAGRIGSGLMSWRHGSYAHVWHDFIQDPDAAQRRVHPQGDQAWIELEISDWRYWQDLFPDRVVSFKVHCAEGLPAQAGIICYHGRPSIPESVTQRVHHSTALRKWHTEPAPWVLDHWRTS